jgi:DNA-binding beta-propeller fold protein YncE
MRCAPLILALAAALAGCGRSSAPEAVWQPGPDGPRDLIYPRAIAYAPQADEFFVIDRMARIQRLDNRGRFLNEWQMPQWSNGKPTGMTVGPDGLLYVADTHYARVAVYRPDGAFVRAWGSSGKQPGEFLLPTDVAFDGAGNIYVAEYGDNDRIQVFDPAGNVIRIIGRFGSADGAFARPQSLAIRGDALYVADSCNHRIAVFNTRGEFERNLGRVGSAPGEFRFPYGLDLDDAGNLIVCEFGNNRVQKIDPETGASLRVWGRPGRAAGELAYPWAVAVGARGRIVVVDAGNNRLQVFK